MSVLHVSFYCLYKKKLGNNPRDSIGVREGIVWVIIFLFLTPALLYSSSLEMCRNKTVEIRDEAKDIAAAITDLENKDNIRLKKLKPFLPNKIITSRYFNQWSLTYKNNNIIILAIDDINCGFLPEKNKEKKFKIYTDKLPGVNIKTIK